MKLVPKAYVFTSVKTENELITMINDMLQDMFGMKISSQRTLGNFHFEYSSDYTAMYNRVCNLSPSYRQNFWQFVINIPTFFPIVWRDTTDFLPFGLRYVAQNRMALDFTVIDTSSKLDIGLVTSNLNVSDSEPPLSITEIRVMYAEGWIYRLVGGEEFYQSHLANSTFFIHSINVNCVLSDDENTTVSTSNTFKVSCPVTLEKMFKIIRYEMPVRSRYSHLQWNRVCRYNAHASLMFYSL